MELLTGINKKEVLKYLGFRGGALEEEYERMIERISAEIIKKSEPKVCSAVLKIENSEPLRFENSEIELCGEDIKRHLKGCCECIFMSATLGPGIDRMIKKAMVTNPTEAVIYDACASSAIENVCDNYVKWLEETYNAEGYYLTERFSPGYGDMPLENQRDLCEVTQSVRRIGLCLSRSMMLEPTKSVTALIGVSERPCEKRRNGCESCRMFYDCEYRKKGEICYE